MWLSTRACNRKDSLFLALNEECINSAEDVFYIFLLCSID